MRIVYHEGDPALELPEGEGVIEKGVPREVRDDIAAGLIERGDFFEAPETGEEEGE